MSSMISSSDAPERYALGEVSRLRRRELGRRAASGHPEHTVHRRVISWLMFAETATSRGWPPGRRRRRRALPRPYAGRLCQNYAGKNGRAAEVDPADRKFAESPCHRAAPDTRRAQCRGSLRANRAARPPVSIHVFRQGRIIERISRPMASPGSCARKAVRRLG